MRASERPRRPLSFILSSAKLLKGSWTHCPDSKSVLFVFRRCSDAHLLLEKVQIFLTRPCHSETLCRLETVYPLHTSKHEYT